jgi:hypothetical protein
MAPATYYPLPLLLLWLTSHFTFSSAYTIYAYEDVNNTIRGLPVFYSDGMPNMSSH